MSLGSAWLLADPQSLPTPYKGRALDDFRASTGFSPETLPDMESSSYSQLFLPKEATRVERESERQTWILEGKKIPGLGLLLNC